MTLIYQWSFFIIIVELVNQICFIYWLQDSLEEQASLWNFVSHGRQDVLTTAIGRPEHPGHVCAARVNVMIKQYYKPASRSSRTSTSMAPEDLEQLTQKIRDQREESIIEKETRQLMLSFNQI